MIILTIRGKCEHLNKMHRNSSSSNNNNNANICIARLKQNSSGALMAQTNTASVFVQMTAVTASGVADRQEDCSKLLIQWLRNSFCQVLFLSQWQRGRRTQQIEDVVGSPARWPAHSQQPGAPVRADTCRPSPPACRPEASEVRARLAWCGRTSWSLSWLELRCSEQPAASSASRRLYRTVNCYSSLDGCWWTHAQASPLSQ